MTDRVEGGDGVGAPRCIRIGDAVVTVAAPGEAPFPLDAVVREEDRYRVLGAPSEASDEAANPLLVQVRAAQDEPLPLGTVLAEEGPPLRLTLIVYDVDREPMCTIPGLAIGLQRLVDVLSEREVRAVALPLVGTTFGKIRPGWALDLVVTALQTARPACPERVWLVVPAPRVEATFRALTELVGS